MGQPEKRTVFLIGLRHQPGELATFATAMAAKGLNIDSIAGVVHHDHAMITFIPDDAEGTRALLDEHNAPYEESEALTVTLPNEPGRLAEATKQLGDAGANITAILPLPAEEGVQLAFAFEDRDKAEGVLG